MTDTAPKAKQAHKRKDFHIPPDIAALGNYAKPIIDAMRSEHRSRQDGKRQVTKTTD